MIQKNYITILIIFLFYQNNIFTQWAQETLARLTLEEKIAQLFIIGVDNGEFVENFCLDKSQNQIINIKNNIFNKSKAEELLNKYKIGGVHFIKYGNLKSAFDSIQYFQSLSTIPLLISQDFEWGLSMRIVDALRFPRNMTLGAIQDDNLIFKLGKEIAKQCKLLGVHINFAPVVDININPENPVINDRSFGQEKINVSNKAIAFANGLKSENIIACAKHYCGHGDTNTDSHYDLPIINHSLERLENIELYPFAQIINSGIDSIMSAHIHVPAIDSNTNMPITLSHNAMTNILQKKLKFNGLIITDALNMKAITKNYEPGQIELQAYLAGNDILLMSENVDIAIEIIKKAILNKQITEQDLDKKVLKILCCKQKLNLHNNKNLEKFCYCDFFSPEAIKLKKELYQSAITVINSDNLILDNNLDKNTLIIIGNQINNYQVFKDNLINRINNYYFLNLQDQENNINNIKNNLDNSETVILCLFDLNKLDHKYYGLSKQILDFIHQLNKTKKIILTIFSTPYSLKLFKDFKNIIMAYENDPDAQEAAAKVISGELKATGKLPIII